MFAIARFDPRAEDVSKQQADKPPQRQDRKNQTQKNRHQQQQPSWGETDSPLGGGRKRRRAWEGSPPSHSSEDFLSPFLPPTVQSVAVAQEMGGIVENDHMPEETETDGCGEVEAEAPAAKDVAAEDETSRTPSSVPSGSDDDDDSDDDESDSGDDDECHDGKFGSREGEDTAAAAVAEPALRVIAPEQHLPAVALLKNRGWATSEGIDDFDIENEDMAGSAIAGGPVGGEKTLTYHDAEITTALRMSEIPIEEAASVWSLPPFLVRNLREEGCERFFPIQSLVIPDVMASERHVQIRARDVCVSSPTGSGKTLAFVLPVLNALAGRRVRRLRALAVLPSRDLAAQVCKVFDRFTRGSDLCVGLAVGQTDFEAEQRSLILGGGGGGSPSGFDDDDAARLRHVFDPHDPRLALGAQAACPSDAAAAPRGGRSAVDVLVATPGRLVDHLDRTPGFTLQHLRFLIIDEADRLVNQSYQSWIGRVTAAVAAGCSDDVAGKELDVVPGGLSLNIDPVTWRRGVGGRGSGGGGGAPSVATAVSRAVPLRKLLFSATLTKDPQKLAALDLINPRHFDAHHLNLGLETAGVDQRQQQQYSLPDGLSEFNIVCKAEQKPLVLLAVLLDLVQGEARQKEGQAAKETEAVTEGGTTVVFTSSIDSTHRLTRLLQLLWAASGFGCATSIAEFSSALNQKQRSELLRRCTLKEGKECVSVIVCSDGMSRGMDLPYVGAVINYDVPRYAKTYVHRCGRTARAGRKGMAISVLKVGQARNFGKMRELIDDPERVEEMGVRKDLVRHAIPIYQSCIRALHSVIEAEGNGDLNAAAPLDPEWLSDTHNSLTHHDETALPRKHAKDTTGSFRGCAPPHMNLLG